MYETVVGLEIHVQLNTASKVFCGDANFFGDDANTHISPVSLAHPGTLPVLNQSVIEKAIKLGLALGSEINLETRFDRKHYFYPDLPKAYQLTQNHMPVCLGGQINIGTYEAPLIIQIHHAHLEEDAGKSMHHLDVKNSMVDLNRAGVPLLEIVTQPDLRSGKQVHDFLARLQQIIRYLGISDANMEEGSMRCDVNVSVRKKGETAYGERCEIKNLNSKKFAMKAVEYEANRQISLLSKDIAIKNTTLHFDAQNGRTFPTREKEGAQDYRYFPDPDLPPVRISEDLIQNLEQSVPEMPDKTEYNLQRDYFLSDYQAKAIALELSILEYFTRLSKKYTHYKSIANFIINRVIPYCKEHNKELSDYPLSDDRCIDLLRFIDNTHLVSSVAYQRVYPEMFMNPTKSVKEIIALLNLDQKTAGEDVTRFIQDILDANPKEVAKYKAGKKAVIGFFIGEAMKKSRGKANPNELKKKFNEILDK